MTEQGAEGLKFLIVLNCNIFQITINLHTSLVSSRKHASSSDESIENLLYYKDCKHKKELSTTAAPLPGPEIEPLKMRQPRIECPFPKMCCTMSCGDDCGGSQSAQSSFFSRQMEPLQNLQPMQPQSPAMRSPILPVQPQIMQRGRKKKKMNQLSNLQLPFLARRGFGFTKEKIKSLISQDEDIRKILKDLVRVTMQKVDLLEMMKTSKGVPSAPRRNSGGRASETSLNSEDYESYVH